MLCGGVALFMRIYLDENFLVANFIVIPFFVVYLSVETLFAIISLRVPAVVGGVSFLPNRIFEILRLSLRNSV